MPKLNTMRACLIHRFALDRNELRRRSDRIEAWFLLALAITFVPLAAAAAVSAARWVHAEGTRQIRAGPRLTQVTAVLMRNAPPATFGSFLLWVPARWTAGGVRETGAVPAAPGTQAGTSVEVWLDGAGKVQQPPLTPNQLSARVMVAAVMTPPLVAGGMLLAWRGLRWLLDRRRLAAWGESWSMIGPSWTR